MGSCHNKGSRTYTTKGRNATGGGASDNEKAALRSGETVYATFEPSKTVKEGDPFNIGVAKSGNGDYRYIGYIPSVDSVAIDKSSIEYKRELRNYNVNAKFKADGTVEVTKGGLFTKKELSRLLMRLKKKQVPRLTEVWIIGKKHLIAVQKGILQKLLRKSGKLKCHARLLLQQQNENINLKSSMV